MEQLNGDQEVPVCSVEMTVRARELVPCSQEDLEG